MCYTFVERLAAGNVSSLNIAQVKQKLGITERECYNKPKSEGSRQPECSPEKEEAIIATLPQPMSQSMLLSW